MLDKQCLICYPHEIKIYYYYYQNIDIKRTTSNIDIKRTTSIKWSQHFPHCKSMEEYLDT